MTTSTVRQQPYYSHLICTNKLMRISWRKETNERSVKRCEFILCDVIFSCSSFGSFLYYYLARNLSKSYKVNLCAIITAALIAFSSTEFMVAKRFTRRYGWAREQFATSSNKSRNIIQKDTQYWLRTTSISSGIQSSARCSINRYILYKYTKQQASALNMR